MTYRSWLAVAAVGVGLALAGAAPSPTASEVPEHQAGKQIKFTIDGASDQSRPLTLTPTQGEQHPDESADAENFGGGEHSNEEGPPWTDVLVAICAGLAVMIALAQAAFFVWQLGLMRAGVKDATVAAIAARASSEAAIEANRIIQEHFREQMRPWLALDVVPDRKLTFLREKVHTVVRIRMTNLGQIPAVNVRAWAEMFNDSAGGTSASALESIVSRVKAWKANGSSGKTILPGQTLDLCPDVLCLPTPRFIGRILAFAEYEFAGCGEPRHTEAAFDLTSFQDDGSNRVIIADEGDIPQTRLRINANGKGDAT